MIKYIFLLIFLVSCSSTTVRTQDIHIPSNLLDIENVVEIPNIKVRIKNNNSNNYRGKIYKKNGYYINELNLEQYLYGVVGNEISYKAPYEAIKAQAIAARTYAMNKMMNNNKDFHVYDDYRSQVYKGKKSENDIIKKAVDDTKGQIMIYDNNPIEAYFHSSSGHKTQSAKNAFGKEVEYLQSVEDFSSDKLWTVKVKKSVYNKHKNNLNNLRKAVGYSKMKSTNILSTKSTDTHVIINGIGYGHGVGMSQMGAMYLSENGYNYDDILKHYYTGIEIKKIY